MFQLKLQAGRPIERHYYDDDNNDDNDIKWDANVDINGRQR